MLLFDSTKTPWKEKVGITILKRLFFLLLIILAAIWTRPYWEDPVREVIPEQVTEAFHSARDFTTQTIEDSDFDFETVKDQAASFYSSIVDSDSAQEPEQEQATPLELTTPEDQSFSIGNVELGDTKSDVEDIYGEPERESENEYGVNWSTYSEGHRENILQDNFAELGVGVDFNDDNQPFFTENFLNDQWLY